MQQAQKHYTQSDIDELINKFIEQRLHGKLEIHFQAGVPVQIYETLSHRKVFSNTLPRRGDT